MREVPSEVTEILVRITNDGLGIHCLPGAGMRVPDGLDLLDWSLSTRNGTVRLAVRRISRLGSSTVDLTLAGVARIDHLRLAAAIRFLGGRRWLGIVTAAGSDGETRFLPRDAFGGDGSARYGREQQAA